MARLKIKKGDHVVVLTGKDKGKHGEVLKMMPEENRAIVKGIAMIRRHQRQTATRTAASSPRRPQFISPTSRSRIPRTGSRRGSGSSF